MTQYCNVMTKGEAEDILQELGLTWQRRIEQPFVNKRAYGPPDIVSLFVHFMNGPTTEVAYYCKQLNTLMIFDTPRVWGQKILANTKIV